MILVTAVRHRCSPFTRPARLRKKMGEKKKGTKKKNPGGMKELKKMWSCTRSTAIPYPLLWPAESSLSRGAAPQQWTPCACVLLVFAITVVAEKTTVQSRCVALQRTDSVLAQKWPSRTRTRFAAFCLEWLPFCFRSAFTDFVSVFTS